MGSAATAGTLTFTTQDDTLVSPDTNGFFEDAWLVDRATGQYEHVSRNDAGEQGDNSTFAGPVSDDGRYVALVSRSTNLGGPANIRENVYLRDRATATTLLVSIGSDGTEGDLDSVQPAMTPDAQVVGFASRSPTFVPESQDFFAYDVFVRDMRPQAIWRSPSPTPPIRSRPAAS